MNEASENFAGWRKVHTDTFGAIFARAFEGIPQAAIQLTAALTRLSRRDFSGALALLEELMPLAENEFDSTAVNYFAGLACELSGDIPTMSEYYDAVFASNTHVSFTPAFHPYYKIAKNAHREGRCTLAVSLYTKALSYYNVQRSGFRPAPLAVANLFCELGMVLLYMQDYDGAWDAISASEKICKDEILSKSYALAVLNAVKGNYDTAYNYALRTGAAKDDASAVVTEIKNGTNPHFCRIRLNQVAVDEAVKRWNECKERIYALAKHGEYEKAEQAIKDIIHATFSKRSLYPGVRVEFSDGIATASCYTGYQLSAGSVYEALLPRLSGDGWRFIAEDEPQ